MRYLIIALIATSACGSREPLSIMTIGDSNGASDHGWVVQLRKLLPDDSIYNYSIPGNTIGFDNLGQERLNTLKQLDMYLADIGSKTNRIDHIIVLLGTNDCKAIFTSRQEEVISNLQRLILALQTDDWLAGLQVKITVVSPPPYGPDDQLLAKYRGGDICVEDLVVQYQKICAKLGATFVSVYDKLKPRFAELSEDGVHLNEEGQIIIANSIQQSLMYP